MIEFRESAESILDRLRALRERDAPTHGGRVLSYVYDPDDERLDELAAAAMRLVQPVNWLDPTVFPSAAAVERDVVAFVRDLLGGDEEVVGTVTSGGTESCLLAVKTARDNWLARQSGDESAGAPSQPATRPRLVAPSTAHAAFRKAAEYFGLELDVVPVGPDGVVAASAVGERLGPDVALVVVSTPSYPHAALDPVADVAAFTLPLGIPLHVDACVGGMALPFWPGLSAWDFRVEGVTSMSVDLHKYGYAPKGVSVLLHRGRDRQRAQYFATTQWPGYPVVTPTLLGSRSTGPVAAAWAIVQALGREGYQERADAARRATEAARAAIAGIRGLVVVGSPVGPMLAVAADPQAPEAERVDPHRWADALSRAGFGVQQQPGLTQSDGSVLPRTAHLTITPVTERVLDELVPALADAADEVRGRPAAEARTLLASLPPVSGRLDAETAGELLAAFGIRLEGGAELPSETAPMLAAIETLPHEVAERLLVELIARVAAA